VLEAGLGSWAAFCRLQQRFLASSAQGAAPPKNG
jgi:hypothetical protein